jgi:hypothetical protein
MEIFSTFYKGNIGLLTFYLLFYKLQSVSMQHKLKPLIGNSSYTLNFDQGKENEIQHHMHLERAYLPIDKSLESLSPEITPEH